MARQETKVYNEDYTQTLKISIYYHLGGMNYFQSVVEKRGYYLSVTPVELSVSECGRFRGEKSTAFSGTKILLMETKRQSDKAFTAAQELAKGRMQELIDHVCRKNGITKKEVV